MARKAVGTRFAKFADKEREAYLALRAEGVGKRVAALGIGVSYETIRQYGIENREWDELDRSAASQANEKVENALFQAALKGSVAGCCAWLYNRDSDNWKDRRKPSEVGDDSFDLSRLNTDERESLRKAVDKALGVEAESGIGNGRFNGVLPHAPS